jgi:hypothetical protein
MISSSDPFDAGRLLHGDAGAVAARRPAIYDSLLER